MLSATAVKTSSPTVVIDFNSESHLSNHSPYNILKRILNIKHSSLNSVSLSQGKNKDEQKINISVTNMINSNLFSVSKTKTISLSAPSIQSILLTPSKGDNNKTRLEVSLIGKGPSD
ncbi:MULTISPECIES: hypothetical protein [unclassified Symbiopectobacterium]|uniref:hypothetical protein n=1 Tax=unclassified Symbiopectobacterium TaxID=2794573 RepID=UPI0022269E9B|nr:MULTISPECIES: hypothetical protein [unclassified Symbiopectobacterium]MCW2474649.1 hypothetical protein [Candidatus Symbiopectobacterium sp. NZEC151]MCW2483447.1 hypothetical protein [Candidatus Symbiopectobacterium sp. NZEC135]MCW2487584.1 hypothetical protein [Candidatus Symbiopectobacterium sp. NZEC127]